MIHTLKRRQILQRILSLGTGLTMAGITLLFNCNVIAKEESRPNIVFIISDDHDNEHLGFLGNEGVKTPNIDLLADQGTVFETCHLTASRCRPSLASLLSGRLTYSYEAKQHQINWLTSAFHAGVID